jgi:hypothetical protein
MLFFKLNYKQKEILTNKGKGSNTIKKVNPFKASSSIYLTRLGQLNLQQLSSINLHGNISVSYLFDVSRIQNNLDRRFLKPYFSREPQ